MARLMFPLAKVQALLTSVANESTMKTNESPPLQNVWLITQGEQFVQHHQRFSAVAPRVIIRLQQ
jgi:hypothetical protein